MTRAFKRVSAEIIAESFGFTARHWRRQAAEGKIPGAYQPSGPGGQWQFDLNAFERWYQTTVRERQIWQPSTKEARRGGVAPSAKGRNTGNHLRQEIKEMLKSVSRSGSKNSKHSVGATVHELPSRTR